MEKAYLMYAQGSARIGHHILYATLVHGDNIGISLHHIHLIFLHYLLLGPVEAIEFVIFMVYVRLWRVDIFLLHSLGA